MKESVFDLKDISIACAKFSAMDDIACRVLLFIITVFFENNTNTQVIIMEQNPQINLNISEMEYHKALSFFSNLGIFRYEKIDNQMKVIVEYDQQKWNKNLIDFI